MAATVFILAAAEAAAALIPYRSAAQAATQAPPAHLREDPSPEATAEAVQAAAPRAVRPPGLASMEYRATEATVSERTLYSAAEVEAELHRRPVSQEERASGPPEAAAARTPPEVPEAYAAAA